MEYGPPERRRRAGLWRKFGHGSVLLTSPRLDRGKVFQMSEKRKVSTRSVARVNARRGSPRGNGFGDAVIDSLRQFIDATERGEPMTARTVKLDLEPRPYDAEAVKSLRGSMGVSQPVFAQLLAVSPKTVQAWEAGRVKPPPLACRLLDKIRPDPVAWVRRQLEHGSRVDPARGTKRREAV